MSKINHIRSMTGFGAATAETEIGRLAVETRSWNNRFLEFSIRTPREFNALDTRLRELVKEKVSRGKVEVSIRWQPTAELAPDVAINAEALERHARTIQEIQRRLGDNGPLPMEYLLQLPGVAQGDVDAAAAEENLWASVRGVVAEALDSLNAERRREAAPMVADLLRHLSSLRALSRTVEAGRGEADARCREKLTQRIEEWRQQTGVPIEAGRLEAELLFYLDRSDIREELVRLTAHIDKFETTLTKPNGAVGKALDFLCQELLREANTIGSKARDTSIIGAVMEMKGLIEALREQIQNLE